MSAEIHHLPPGVEDPDDLPLAPSGSVYLDAYLAPFRQWLERDTVTEIIVNRPGEIWIEDAEHPGMQRIKAAEIDDKLVQRLAEQVARVSHQGINREHPLLGATLPDERFGGARIQFCGPPATRKHWAMAIRRHRRLDLPLDAYDAGPLKPAREHAMPDPAEQPIAFLRAAIAARKTILISGGTSTGKTTFLNAMLGEIPAGERVVLVEDTAELKLPGANGVGLIAVKGELGEAKVTANELLQSALRLRPDRIVLGELRGAEIGLVPPRDQHRPPGQLLDDPRQQPARRARAARADGHADRHRPHPRRYDRLRRLGDRRRRPARPQRRQAWDQRDRPQRRPVVTLACATATKA